MHLQTFLTRMAPKTLARIAKDLLGADRAAISPNPVGAVKEHCRDYRLTSADLKARYPELTSDRGLRDK